MEFSWIVVLIMVFVVIWASKQLYIAMWVYFQFNYKCQKLVFMDISFYGHVWYGRKLNSSGGNAPTWGSIKSFKIQYYIPECFLFWFHSDYHSMTVQHKAIPPRAQLELYISFTWVKKVSYTLVIHELSVSYMVIYSLFCRQFVAKNSFHMVIFLFMWLHALVNHCG